MPDLPTKEEIVERMADQCRFTMHGDYIGYNRSVIRDALNDLTVPDLLSLLRERGFSIHGGKLGSGAWTLSMDKPDALP